MTTDEATTSVITSGHRGRDHRPDDDSTDQERTGPEAPGGQRNLASARRTRWGVPSGG